MNKSQIVSLDMVGSSEVVPMDVDDESANPSSSGKADAQADDATRKGVPDDSRFYGF